MPFVPRASALVTGAGSIGRAIASGAVVRACVHSPMNRETVTAAAKSSTRPELAVAWVGVSRRSRGARRCWPRHSPRLGE
jgi:hypothetical protein